MIAPGALAITAASLAAALLAQGPHAVARSRKADRTSESKVAAKTASKTASASGAPTAAKRNAARAKSEDAEVASAAGGDATATSDKASDKAEGTKAAKTRNYTFGALDVEGKMKTPQLLYFLNRVKLELEMSAPDKKSFMKELEHSADDSSL